jgi:uncharacterized protein
MLAAALAAACAGHRRPAPPNLAIELVAAARNDSVAVVERLIANGLPPDTAAPNGTRALTEAARYGRRDVVDALLADEADPALADRLGWRAIDYAMDSGRADIAARLTVQAARFAGASGDALVWFARIAADTGSVLNWSRVLDGELASLGLFYATLYNRAPVVGSMRRAAGFPNRLGYAPLDAAVRFGHGSSVEALLAGGANPDLESNGPLHQTPLMEAARVGDPAIARRLIRAGARVDRADGHGETALFWAVRSSRTAIARLLLDEGADPAVRNRTGETALDVAHQVGDRQMIALLSAHPVRVSN